MKGKIVHAGHGKRRSGSSNQPRRGEGIYIKEEVYPDVYSGPDFYKWSGEYSIFDRTLERIWTTAATNLVTWVKKHPADTIRLMAHSHGNNVANRATHLGLPTSCTLIQMSPGVRRWNLPEMSTVSSGTLFNIYASRDLVLAIDGSAVTYTDTVMIASSKQRRRC